MEVRMKRPTNEVTFQPGADETERLSLLKKWMRLRDLAYWRMDETERLSLLKKWMRLRDLAYWRMDETERLSLLKNGWDWETSLTEEMHETERLSLLKKWMRLRDLAYWRNGWDWVTSPTEIKDRTSPTRECFNIHNTESRLFLNRRRDMSSTSSSFSHVYKNTTRREGVLGFEQSRKLISCTYFENMKVSKWSLMS